MWSENPSQWTILEPLCYSSFVFATLVHGVIGYKFCWLLPENHNQGIPTGDESAKTPIGNESLCQSIFVHFKNLVENHFNIKIKLYPIDGRDEFKPSHS